MLGQVFPALACTVLWYVCYEAMKRCIMYRFDSEWSCRTITAAHAIVVATLAAVSWFKGPNPFKNPGGYNTDMETAILSISLGYFLFDCAWCLTHQTEGATMLVHHLMSTIVLARVLIKGTGGTEATAGLFCLEITNPFLQTRWFIRSAGYRDTIYYSIVEILFLFLFIFFRMVWGSILCYTTVNHSVPDRESKISCLMFYGISWVFLAHISKYFFRKYVTRASQDDDQLSIDETGLDTSTPSGVDLRRTNDGLRRRIQAQPTVAVPALQFPSTQPPTPDQAVADEQSQLTQPPSPEQAAAQQLPPTPDQVVVFHQPPPTRPPSPGQVAVQPPLPTRPPSPGQVAVQPPLPTRPPSPGQVAAQQGPTGIPETPGKISGRPLSPIKAVTAGLPGSTDRIAVAGRYSPTGRPDQTKAAQPPEVAAEGDPVADPAVAQETSSATALSDILERSETNSEIELNATGSESAANNSATSGEKDNA